MSLSVTKATSADDLDHIKKLFTEYQDWLGVDLCFQDFQAELKALAAKYDVMLLARWNGEVCGCVAIWPVDKKDTCEMKRLYVRDAYKKKGIGRALAELIFEEARNSGYRFMCLDTLSHLTPALKLYDDLGFHKSAPYYDNPLDEVIYMEKSL
ncbi:GNAT family N-acetyltransferase [Terasakiella sp. A23]|uniref:GNAT family N-acetyltransferase n=1 Tax=Terasakiella sp. FCG-A23 TaxID=3080561 RepID=UPI002954B44F|nr:GNAT family N-acetyltransferase [Terasakiella sp. A23]MDV7338977.1 GNAT family N-acetyltransferase [Terasakiella sp. A23]